MSIARTEDGVEVEWTSSSVPVEQLDAAIARDRNLTGIYALFSPCRFCARILT
jgi:hypothetical protein